jgi:hypothetical protein
VGSWNGRELQGKPNVAWDIPVALTEVISPRLEVDCSTVMTPSCVGPRDRGFEGTDKGRDVVSKQLP